MNSFSHVLTFAGTRSRLARLGVLAAGAALLLVAPGCGDGGAETASELATLRSQVAEAKRKNDQLIERLDRVEKRIDRVFQDVDRIAHERVRADMASTPVAGSSGSAADEAGAMEGPPQPTARELVALLASDDGQELVEKAMAAVEARRNEERRERMVAGMVERFAQAAALTPAQTTDVTRIIGGSFAKMGELWSSMRGGGDMTPEQRAAQRDENLAKMEEIREATSAEMKAVLNSEQYAIYEEQANRMRGFGGGFGGGGDGGRGGRFGR